MEEAAYIAALFSGRARIWSPAAKRQIETQQPCIAPGGGRVSLRSEDNLQPRLP